MVAEQKPLFPLGQVVATLGALEVLEQAGQSPSKFLDRHVRGDWGDVCEEDAEANNLALKDGSRIFSVYHTKLGEKIWCISEADRSSTCILLPSEY
jgi:hypothetical protein